MSISALFYPQKEGHRILSRQRGKYESGTYSRSFEVESWTFVQHKNYRLQLLQKNEPQPIYPKIPVTLQERLAFYRAYVSTPAKSYTMFSQFPKYRTFVWTYVIHLFFTYLPLTYIYLFLSSYSFYHLFLPKMAPLSAGSTVLIIMATFFQLATSADLLTLYVDSIAEGIASEKAWSSCQSETYKVENSNIHCFDLREFEEKVLKLDGSLFQSMPISIGVFHENITYKFQMAPLLYYVTRLYHLSRMTYLHSHFVIYYILVWIVAGLFYKQIFRRCIWQIQNYVQWLLSIVFLLISFHMIYIVFEIGTPVPEIPIMFDNKTIFQFIIKHVDYTFLSDSMGAPPIVHMLTSRSCGPAEINPGRDAAIIQISNAIYVLLRRMLFHTMKTYCESKIQVPIESSTLNPFPWFYVIPIYFAKSNDYGDLFTLIFYILAAIMDFLTFTITYQLLLELLCCEWPKLRKWTITLVFPILAFILISCTSYTCRIVLYMYSNYVTTLCEIMTLICLYPVTRLEDDISFNCGNRPSGLITVFLRCLPMIFLVLSLIEFSTFILVYGFIEHLNWQEFLPGCLWCWVIPVVPFVLGMLYMIIKASRSDEASDAVTKPVPWWGPKDHVQRQLRKQYDSSEYIASQAMRYLSRNFMAKAEAASYKLNIDYSSVHRATVIYDTLPTDQETKTAGGRHQEPQESK